MAKKEMMKTLLENLFSSLPPKWHSDESCTSLMTIAMTGHHKEVGQNVSEEHMEGSTTLSSTIPKDTRG